MLSVADTFTLVEIPVTPTSNSAVPTRLVE
jgi:hypothetical protein